MSKNYQETALGYIRDYIYDQAANIIDDKFGDTLNETDRDFAIEKEYENLVEVIKKNLK